MKNILVLILSLSLGSCGAQNTAKPQKGDQQQLHFQDLFVAANTKGVECYRIPSLVTAPNGDLIAVIDERIPGCADLRGNRNINIVERRSTDNGKTWSEVEHLVDFPDGQSASDPSMIVDEETGTVFLFYNYMDLDKEKNVYYLQVVKSTDNGKTWSKPEDITSQIAKPEWYHDFKFITSGRGIQTKSGRLLHTLVDLDKGVFLFGSDDHGKSWFLIDSPVKPADESKVIQLANGDYMINSRVNTGAGYRFIHISKDKGKTWKTRPAKKLVDPGNNASIIRYSSIKNGADKNRLLFCNSNNAKERKNLTVRISYDEGKTWSDGKTIYSGGAAYSSMTVMENGDIGVFFEKDNYQKNSFTCFSLAWLTNGKDEFPQ